MTTNEPDSLSAVFRKAAAQLIYLPQTVRMVWEAAPGWTACWAGLLAAEGVLPVAVVYLSRAVVDRLVAAIRAHGEWESARPAIVTAALMAAVLLASELLRSAASYVRTGQAERVRDHISGLIHEKSVAVDLAFYDCPEFYDRLHRAKEEATFRPVALLESVGTVAQSAITLLAIAAVLLPYGWWLPAVLAAGTLPALLVVLHFGFRYNRWRRRVTKEERRTWYYEWLLTSGAAAAEIRLFALGGHFRSAYQGLRSKLRRERVELASKQALAEVGAGAAALVVAGGAMLWMLWRAVRGLATLGDLVLFYQAFQQGLRLMRSLLENIGQLYGNILFLGNLFEFLSLEPGLRDPPNPVPAPPSLGDGIRFHDVTFRYPGSDRAAVDRFTLFLPAGQITAVVGPNGAGKSTLIKLLARFYDPEHGRIEMDGVDLREFAIQELRGRLTVLFQQPVHFNATVRENIAYGDLADKTAGERVEAAARDAGADSVAARLPERLDTLLGRWLADDGTELSVGEWQRVALARAFLRRSPILILDEPTSAMDPWAEADWLARFRDLASGRTALVITHRFTTAMFADVIHVMEAGRIVESGSHEELLRRKGRYAEAWTRQNRTRASETP